MERGVCRSAHCGCHFSFFPMLLVPRCGIAFRQAAVPGRRLTLRLLPPRAAGLEEVAGLEKLAPAQTAEVPAPVMGRARVAKEFIQARVAGTHRAARDKAEPTATMIREGPIAAAETILVTVMGPERMERTHHQINRLLHRINGRPVPLHLMLATGSESDGHGKFAFAPAIGMDIRTKRIA